MIKLTHMVKEVSPSRVKYKVGEKVKVKDGFPKYGGMEAKIVGYDKSNNNKNSFELLFKGKGKVSWFIPTDLRKLDESINEGPSVISMKESEKVWDALVKKFSDNKNDSIEYLNKDKSYRNMAIKAIFTATKF